MALDFLSQEKNKQIEKYCEINTEILIEHKFGAGLAERSREWQRIRAMEGAAVCTV